MKKRNEAEETLGVVRISSNSQIHGQSAAIINSSGSLHHKVNNDI